jgi:hypothetical protein
MKSQKEKPKFWPSSLIFTARRKELYRRAKITFLCRRVIPTYWTKVLKVNLIYFYAKEGF